MPSLLQDVADTVMAGKAGTEVVRSPLMLESFGMARGKQAWDLRQDKIHDPHSSYRFSCPHSTC